MCSPSELGGFAGRLAHYLRHSFDNHSAAYTYSQSIHTALSLNEPAPTERRGASRPSLHVSTTIRPWSALLVAVTVGAVLSACAEEPPPPRVIPGPARDRILAPTPVAAIPLAPVEGAASSVYVVQPGDSVALLADRFGSSVEAIAAANNLPDPATLEVGRQLMIPGAVVIGGASAPTDGARTTFEVARPPVLPHAKAPPSPAPDPLEVLSQTVLQSPALPYAGIAGGVAVIGLFVHLLAVILHELRPAVAGLPQLAVATVGGARQRADATRSASMHAFAVIAPPVRLLSRGLGFAARPLHSPLARVRAAALGPVRARLPRRPTRSDDGVDGQRAGSSLRTTVAAWRQETGPAVHELWARALTFAAHRSRLAAAMPYVRRYAGTSGLAWGMSGRVAAPSRIATAPTEHEIEASLAAGDLAVHFRPVFRVGGGLSGAMAVLRWRHPLRGWTAADRIVESPNPGDAGPRLLLQLLLSETCRFAGAWRRSDPSFRVTLSLSRSQLGDPELPKLIAAEVARVQLPADALEFELDERAAVSSVEHTASVFRRLRDIGVALALDNFTGVLAEEELEAIAPDAVKVDFWAARAIRMRARPSATRCEPRGRLVSK